MLTRVLRSVDKSQQGTADLLELDRLVLGDDSNVEVIVEVTPVSAKLLPVWEADDRPVPAKTAS